MKKSLLEAISTLVGMTIGAGILGIPYVIAQAGFLTGIIIILLLAVAVLIINLYIGEIALRTKGKHQITGYAEKYLGKRAKTLMTVSMVLYAYGALTAYTIGEGQALSAIIGLSPLLLSLIFFALMAVLVYKGLQTIKRWEFYLTFAILFIVVLLFLLSVTSIDLTNFTGFSFEHIFLPYGVILFAIVGTAAIPNLKEELKGNEHLMKKAIIYGSIIPIVAYLVFTTAVVGVTGLATTEVATIGLGSAIGTYMSFIGNIFGAMTMATSFLLLALALCWVYSFDYKIKWTYAFLLTMVPPLVIVLLDLASFVQVLGITGAVAGGIDGLLVVLIHRKATKARTRKPEYTFKGNLFIDILLISIFVLGIVYTIVTLF
ncbi:GerAB/ArcD/ProY family transporter [archaeon]|nr:GerAB/ArcD/ProY family transporter [archaeon]